MSTSLASRLGNKRAMNITATILSSPRLTVGLLLFIPIVLVVFFGPYVSPMDPLESHVTDKFAGPGGKYILGTDHLGRDLLSRVMIGGRSSLLLGFGATGLALLFGVPIGMFAGYSKGRVDELLMRAMDIIMSIPTLLLGILILVVLPPNLVNVIIAVGTVYVPRIARVTRSATLAESEEPYIQAAKARGESDAYILTRELLPNVSGPIIVEGSIRVGYAILVGTSLSFLGIGTQPPAADWGFMIATARLYIFQTPWFLLWPSIALSLTILSMNLIGDGLRDVLDPREVTA
jgi:peptide/nickel transport system permease protein